MRPPQVKANNAQITAKYLEIRMIRFEDQQLTSYSGLLILTLKYLCNFGVVTGTNRTVF
jgi:hypothetical protein